MRSSRATIAFGGGGYGLLELPFSDMANVMHPDEKWFNADKDHRKDVALRHEDSCCSIIAQSFSWKIGDYAGRDEWVVTMRRQPPNSPDLNVIGTSMRRGGMAVSVCMGLTPRLRASLSGSVRFIVLVFVVTEPADVVVSMTGWSLDEVFARLVATTEHQQQMIQQPLEAQTQAQAQVLANQQAQHENQLKAQQEMQAALVQCVSSETRSWKKVTGDDD
ncbi:hypothetical protein H257_13320 [Aphanomyces astaci]|uniref:Uncharacterized protein n=1 Tax=Aphanomyces astaci TaxID=112090 RepID=W4FVB3_APHAT|nr:hypothetical protein H257_13320 [Aphanomyces astaci]ETV71437.1 hypothetical protein H257_13320 [Aphanomyces astaci]|eukprot:XP_009839102.1 hypothetical protein H257_13320 [Aphanomyces astaci]